MQLTDFGPQDSDFQSGFHGTMVSQRNVVFLEMSLTNAQKKHLRGLSHDRHPVVTVADKGLSETVMVEVEQALNHHELIKIKLRGERGQRGEWVDRLLETTGAELVHQIGQVVSLYRRHPEKPVIDLPKK